MREHSAALNRLSDSTCSLGAHFAPVWQRPGAEAPQMRASRAPGRLESPRPREVCAGGRRCAARDAALEPPRPTHPASPACASAELLARRAASTLPPSSQSPRATHHASTACASAELHRSVRGQPSAGDAPRFACRCSARSHTPSRAANRFACMCNSDLAFPRARPTLCGRRTTLRPPVQPPRCSLSAQNGRVSGSMAAEKGEMLAVRAESPCRVADGQRLISIARISGRCAGPSKSIGCSSRSACEKQSEFDRLRDVG